MMRRISLIDGVLRQTINDNGFELKEASAALMMIALEIMFQHSPLPDEKILEEIGDTMARLRANTPAMGVTIQ